MQNIHTYFPDKTTSNDSSKGQNKINTMEKMDRVRRNSEKERFKARNKCNKIKNESRKAL